MVASQASDILRLPAEPLLAIFYLLSPNSEDIVALRQTCKALYEIEKKHHTTIWKLCIDSLSEEAALFLPTFSWRSPSSKIQEQLVRRASCFKKALYQYRDMSLADNAPRDTVELKLPTDFSDLALLPGGRFLLGISSGTIGVFDLLPYYESGGTPAEIGSFPCAHMCEQFLARHAVTFAGENADRIRFMLAFPDDPDGCSPRDNYDLEEDGEGYVFLIEVHEISFADEELAHKLYGPLPLGRDESDTVDHDLYTMSADCVGAILDTRNAVVWNYVNETYHMFTLENHETETPADILLTEDRLVVFSVKQTKKDGEGNQGYHAGEMVSYELQPMEALDLADRELITVPHWQSPEPAPFTNTLRKALPLASKGLKGLNPSRTSKASWGYSRGQYDSSPSSYPLHDYRTETNSEPGFHVARRHYAPENIFNTHWLHLGVGDDQHTSGAANLATVAHITQTFPLQDAYWCTSGFDRRASGGELVSVLQWEKHLPDDPHHQKDRTTVICASISRTPRESEGKGEISTTNLVPLETYTINPRGLTKTWDFCPLSGIMVMRHGRGWQKSSIQIHDYVRAYLTQK